MDSQFNIKLIQSVELKKKRITRQQIELTKKNGNTISLKEVYELFNELKESGENPTDISIIGMNAERLTTIITDGDDKNRYWDEDYLHGKSAEVLEMLTNFTKLELLLTIKK